MSKRVKKLETVLEGFMGDMDLIKDLEDARLRMKADCHGIGEPVIRLDPKTLGIAKDDHSLIYISMRDLIELVAGILK